MISGKAIVKKIQLGPYQSPLSTNYFQKTQSRKEGQEEDELTYKNV